MSKTLNRKQTEERELETEKKYSNTEIQFAGFSMHVTAKAQSQFARVYPEFQAYSG